MLDAALQLDQDLMLWLNRQHTPLLDSFWWIVSQKYTWIPLYLLLLVLAIRRYGKRSWILLLGFGLSVGAADYAASGVLKPAVGRVRPCQEPQLADRIHTVHGYCRSSPSFPSSHAGNSLCVLLLSLYFFARQYRWLIPIVVLYCLLHSYSRIYLGVHYPGDILGGWLVGGLCAGLCTRVLAQTGRRALRA